MDVTRGASVLVGTANPSSGWTISTGGASYDVQPRPTSKTHNKATYSWQLPSSVPASAAVGSVTVTASASDTDGNAPATGISGGNIDCTGIKVDPHPNSGCSSGVGAQAALVLQPSQSGTARQEFRITGPGTDTITVGGSQTVQVTYSGSNAPPTPTTKTVSTPPTPHSSAGQTAAVAGLSGEVTYRHAGGPPQPVTAGTKLGKDDLLQTGVDSQVKLKFADGSVMAVSEMTELLVVDLLSKGSRQAITVQLKLGEVSAQVNPKKAFQTDFKAGLPCTEIAPATLFSPAVEDCPASVRGSKMRVFYDPAAKIGIVATLQDVSTFTPRVKGTKTIVIPAGKEVAETPSGVSALAPIGKAGARGGVDVEVAAGGPDGPSRCRCRETSRASRPGRSPRARSLHRTRPPRRSPRAARPVGTVDHAI